MIESARKRDPAAIRSLSRDLEDIALARLLGQVAARKPVADGQTELFGEYPGLHQLLGIEVEQDGRRVVHYKLLPKMTLRELGAWLSTEHKKSSTRRQRNPGMVKLLRDLSRIAGSQDVTIEDAMAARAARRGEKRA